MCTELLLAPNDLKKLHEFEEKCVAGYFRDKKESQQDTQINRIRSTADKWVHLPNLFWMQQEITSFVFQLIYQSIELCKKKYMHLNFHLK